MSVLGLPVLCWGLSLVVTMGRLLYRCGGWVSQEYQGSVRSCLPFQASSGSCCLYHFYPSIYKHEFSWEKNSLRSIFLWISLLGQFLKHFDYWYIKVKDRTLSMQFSFFFFKLKLSCYECSKVFDIRKLTQKMPCEVE